MTRLRQAGAIILGKTYIVQTLAGRESDKPTSGRLSNDDFAPGLPGNEQEVFIPQPGPIARTVSDLRLAMATLVETSLKVTHDLVPPVPWPDPENVRLDALRIGFYTDNGYFPVAPAVRRAVEEAVAALQAQGATMHRPVSWPQPGCVPTKRATAR